jgi:hypothetical protein
MLLKIGAEKMQKRIFLGIKSRQEFLRQQMHSRLTA